MNDKKRPLIIGITGGTGSGKSTVCKAIIDNIPEENIATLEQDAYYKDQSHLTFEERLKTNYDHPLSFDNKLLIKHIEELCEDYLPNLMNPMMSKEEVQRKLGVSEATLNRMVKRGDIPNGQQDVGGHVRWWKKWDILPFIRKTHKK